MTRYEELLERAKAVLAEAKALVGEDGTIPADKQERFDELVREAKELRQKAENLKALAKLQEAGNEVKSLADIVNERKGPGGPDTPEFNMAAMHAMGLTVPRVEIDNTKQQILQEVIGEPFQDDWRNVIHRQTVAFRKWMAVGDRGLDRDEHRLLSTQIYPGAVIDNMIEKGFTPREVKQAMQEAQGSLGGYAVPPVLQAEIVRRLPGMTAVRRRARVVTLARGNAAEFPTIEGGDDLYTSGLRGRWGTETQDPERVPPFRTGLTMVTAHIYTYAVPLSQSLVEDADVTGILTGLISETAAADEDIAFLVGDGVGKPLGIMPGGVNALNLREQNSGDASGITPDAIKLLKRRVPSQYRANAVWVANSDTYAAIEVLKDANGQYLFPDLSDEDRLLGRDAFESEGMPDIAANSYPIIFGDLSGYWILERAGLTVLRFQDSRTGPNLVEFHIRRRVGGMVTEPWKFAVMKIAA